MQWISENGFFILLALAFVAIHMFGHRHGGHGGHARTRSAGNRDDTEAAHDHGNAARGAAPSQDAEPSGRHRHGGVS